MHRSFHLIILACGGYWLPICAGADASKLPHSFEENRRKLKTPPPTATLAIPAIQQGLDVSKKTKANSLDKKIGSALAAALLESAVTDQLAPPQIERARNYFLWPKKPQNSIFANPIFQENFLYLLENAKRDRFIVGGLPALKLTDYPSCVMVGTGRSWEASGAVIAPRIVLTAAHITDKPERVFFGTSLEDPLGITRKVVAKAICPGYSPSDNHKNDLMLLLLDAPAPPFAAVAKLAPSDVFTKEKLRVVRIAGFGVISGASSVGLGVKRWGDVAVVTPDSSGNDDAQYGAHPGLEFVAGDNRVDTCYGDSGGPAYWEDVNGKWWLVGITSRWTLNRRRNCGDGGIYVRPDKYQDWIQQMARQWNQSIDNLQ